MRVAFDFDTTLMFPVEIPNDGNIIIGKPNKEFVEKARDHINNKDTVFIITSRNETEYSKKQILRFLLNNGLNIPPSRIFHTNTEDKGNFIHDNKIGIELLYDDCPHELENAKKFGIKGVNAFNADANKSNTEYDKEYYGIEEGKKNKTFKTFIRPIALDEEPNILDQFKEGSKGLKRQLRKKVSHAKKKIPNAVMNRKQIEHSFKDAFMTAQEMNKKGGGTTTVFHMIHPSRLPNDLELEDVFKFLFSKSPKEISVSVEKGVWDASHSVVLEGEGKLTSYFDTDVYTTIDDYGNKVPLEPYRDKNSHSWDEGTVRLSDVEWDTVYVSDDIPGGWHRDIDDLADEYDLNVKHFEDSHYGAMGNTASLEKEIEELTQNITYGIDSIDEMYRNINNELQKIKRLIDNDEIYYEHFEELEDALEDKYSDIPSSSYEMIPERAGLNSEQFIEELQDSYNYIKEYHEFFEELQKKISEKEDDIEELIYTINEQKKMNIKVFENGNNFKSYFQGVELSESEKLQKAVINNPEFRKWFNGSKAVDKNGNPMVMFHGTKSDEHFTVFSVDGIPYVQDDDAEEEVISDLGSGADPNAFIGAHFAQEPEVASKFAMADVDWLKNRYLKDKNGFGRVYPVFLKVKNPIIFKSENDFNDFIYSQDIDSDYVEHALMDLQEDENDYDELVEKYSSSPEKRIEVNMYAMSLANNMDDGGYGMTHPVEYARDLGYTARSVLIKNGYDGIRYKNDVEGGISWVVFQPNQIKSALGSAYTDDPDIMKEKKNKNSFIRPIALSDNKKKIATPSQLLKYIDMNTKGALNYSVLRDYLNKSEYYILDDVDISKLDIQDEDLVSHDIKKPFESDKPIVIDNNYFVIDGRHRVVNAKNKGKDTILAWKPMEKTTLSSAYTDDPDIKMDEDIVPRRPTGKISKRKIIKNPGSNTAKEILQYSFKTKSGNNVKVHFKPQGEDSYDVIFYVNDTLDDDSSTKSGTDRDKEILNGVLYTVKDRADRLGAKELTFEAWEGAGDTVNKKDMNLDQPRIELKTVLNDVIKKVQAYEPNPIPHSRMRIELAKKYGNKLKQLYDLDKEKLLSMLSDLDRTSEGKNVEFYQHASDIYSFIHNDSMYKKVFNEKIDPTGELKGAVKEYANALKSHSEKGIEIKRNRRPSIYERLMKRYFADEWDITKNGNNFTLTRKKTIKEKATFKNFYGK